MNNINFKGINISNANVLSHKMSIYKLTEKDRPFIKQLSEKVELKKLFPDITPDDFKIYDFFLKRGLNNAMGKNKEGLLLACDGIPCGIMANKTSKSTQVVNYICTWPIKSGVKAPFGAQTLFAQMFGNFLKSGANFIELNATRFGSAISKYRHLGFKSYGGDNYTEIMRIKRCEVMQSCKKLRDKINLQPSKDNTDLDLFRVLKLNY